MSTNTGRKVYQFLKEVNASTGVPTGNRKANSTGDPDYTAPVVDYTLCPVAAWIATGPTCETMKTCAPGWTLSTDQSQCTMEETSPASPPTGNGGTPGIASKQNSNQWNNGGALLFSTYNSDGSQIALPLPLLIPHFWVNGTTPWNTVTRNTVDGRMNAAGIWIAGHTDGTPFNEFVGFSRKFTTSIAKTIHVGIAGDNRVKIVVNGVTLVDMTNQNGGPNFNYWNIYPINANAGDNFIELYGMNFGSVAGFAAEIYDNTRAQISAAGSVSDLSIIFSTANIVGQAFDLGQTQGYSCSAGWSLDTSGGGVPVCRKIDTAIPTLKNTGIKSFATRARVTNGVPDGYTEPNTNGGGLGPYFAPVTDTTNCPTS